MIHTNTKHDTFLGFDVGKYEITAYDSATGQTHTLDNTAAAIRRVLKTCPGHAFAVCEATGGYEGDLLECLVRAGITAHRADARKVKSFIRSFGTLGKTDAIDARALSRYGQDRHGELAIWRPLSKDLVELQALTHQRADMVKNRAAEKNRLQAPGPNVVKAYSRKLIAFLTKQIDAIERQIAKRIAASDELTQIIECLQAMTGVGVVTAQAVCIFMPELGTLSRRQAASLAGVAPHPKDSSTIRGYRRIHGGRSHIRRTLYMAALAARRHDPKMSAVYERLIANGKKPMVAIAAIMRKIIVIMNAKVRDYVILQQS